MKFLSTGGSKSWTVDHTYDDEDEKKEELELERDDNISTISGGSKPPPYAQDPTRLIESPSDKKKRQRSHWVAYTTMFVMTIGFSVVLSGVWPYLQSLYEKNRFTKEDLGWVVAANPLGQMIASPIVGYIGNRLGSIRLVCYATMVLFIIGNLIYGFLPGMTDLWYNSAYHIMIISRFLVGLSSANVTLCRSYLACSTTTKERTAGISIISAAQSLGFVVGPAIQTVLSLSISEEQMRYRSTGWVAAALGVINFVLLTPWVFQEYDISERERELMKASGHEKEELILPRTDYVGLSAVLFGFFMCQFVYVLLETLMEPFMADQYEWCNNLAVVVVGVAFAIAGLISVAMFYVATRMSKTYDERLILIIGAFVPLSLGTFLFIPWGPEQLTLCPPENDTITTATAFDFSYNNNNHFINPLSLINVDLYTGAGATRNLPDTYCTDPEVDCLGCPAEQTWCEGYDKLPMAQFLVAYVIVIAGYPFGVGMSNAIYSKILGPKPQGFWMGILTSAGSLSRVLGPIFVSYLYANKGTTLTFSIIFIGMLAAALVLSLSFKRIVPMKVIKVNDPSRT